MSGGHAWPSREELLRDGIPTELRAAAIERARTLRRAAIDHALRRIAETLRVRGRGLGRVVPAAPLRRG